MNLNGYTLKAVKTMETPDGISYSGNIYYSNKKIGIAHNGGFGGITDVHLLPDFRDHYSVLTEDFVERLFTLHDYEKMYKAELRDNPNMGVVFVTYNNPFDLRYVLFKQDKTSDEVHSHIHKTSIGKEIESIELFRTLDDFNVTESFEVNQTDEVETAAGIEIEAETLNEFIRHLKIAGITVDRDTRSKNPDAVIINNAGEVFYMPDEHEQTVGRIRDEVEEYVSAFHNAKRVPNSDEKYDARILTSFNNHDLTAIRYPDGIIEFDVSSGHGGLTVSHSHESYAGAKHEFAIRTGMIDRDLLFTRTQLKAIRSALSNFLTIDSGDYIDAETAHTLNSVIKQINSIGTQPSLAEILAETRLDFANLSQSELKEVYAKLLTIGKDWKANDLTAKEADKLLSLTNEIGDLLTDRGEYETAPGRESELNQGEEM